jgi:hypothetical protein
MGACSSDSKQPSLEHSVPHSSTTQRQRRAKTCYGQVPPGTGVWDGVMQARIASVRGNESGATRLSQTRRLLCNPPQVKRHKRPLSRSQFSMDTYGAVLAAPFLTALELFALGTPFPEPRKHMEGAELDLYQIRRYITTALVEELRTDAVTRVDCADLMFMNMRKCDRLTSVVELDERVNIIK